MEEIGDSRTESRDGKGQEPVGDHAVTTGGELEHQPDEEEQHLGATAPALTPGLLGVGGGLPESHREDFHHPENEDDLWDLPATGAGKKTADQGDPTVLEARAGRALGPKLSLDRPT